MTREDINALFDPMIEHQKNKVVKIAQQFYPGTTPEDLRNAQDFPKLLTDANFNFEDGILSGYIAAKMALVQEISKS